MSCILHTIGSRVSLANDVRLINESTRVASIVKRGEAAIIQSIDRHNHKVTIKVESTGLTLTVDAAAIAGLTGHAH